MLEQTVVKNSFPELGAGGFSRFDGSVEFYGRVSALSVSNDRVLDIGAGRGAWHFDDECGFRRQLRSMRGKVAEVVGVDVDSAVLSNPTLDRAFVVGPNDALPFADASFDIIIADYVLEHVAAPLVFAGEISRVLRPGGWFCARTPNKWGYISICTRIVSNRHHAGVLQKAQPSRRTIDVFPTHFRMNTLAQISSYFPDSHFESFSYTYQAEPHYFFGKAWLLALMRLVDQLLPRFFQANLFIFLCKKSDLVHT